jgi:hypothetical protein
VKLVIARTDEAASPNAAILNLAFDTPYASVGGVVRGMATIGNFSSAASQELLDIKSGEERLAQRAVDLAPGSTADVSFEFEVPSSASGKWLPLVASLSGDRLAPDDRRFAVLNLSQPPKVLVVESGDAPERARAGFYLRKAFSAGLSQAPVKTVKPSELNDLNVDPFSAVFLLGLQSVSDRAAVRLERYLESGGAVAVFAGDAFEPGAWARVDWMPALAGERVELPAERLPSLLLEPQHPLFRTWDAQTPFPPLPQKRVFSWKPRAGARALVSVGKGIPFLMYGERGAGKVIVVNASADLSWGGFPISPAFLPVVQEIGRLSSARSGASKNILVGDLVAAPGGVPKDQALNVRLPGGETLSVPPAQPLLEEAARAGVYEVNAATEGQVHAFAVNVEGREGDLAVESSEALAARIPHEAVLGLESLQKWLERSRGIAPMWPLLLVCAVLLFALETAYSNRLARNHGHGDEAAIKTGRLVRRRSGLAHERGGVPAEGGTP